MAVTGDRELVCEQIQNLWKQISMALSYTLSRVLEDSALTFHQFYVMKVINGSSNVTLTMLCRELNLSKGALSLTLNKLVQEGYVSRCENPSDRRHRNIVLTNKGERVLKNTGEKIRDAFVRLTSGLTLEELENIKSSLEVFNETISGEIKKETLKQ